MNKRQVKYITYCISKVVLVGLIPGWLGMTSLISVMLLIFISHLAILYIEDMLNIKIEDIFQGDN